MHTYRLAVGSWRYRQLPTENRRLSVGVYRTPTRSSGLIGAIPPIRNLNRRKSQSALVGRCVPNVNPIVGANRQVCIEFRLDSTVGGKLTNHSYHFRARLVPRFGGKICLRYSTSLLGEPGSPSIVVLCGCAFVWTMSKICVKEVC